MSVGESDSPSNSERTCLKMYGPITSSIILVKIMEWRRRTRTSRLERRKREARKHDKIILNCIDC